MRLYLNADVVDDPYGGANSFLKTLVHALRKRGMEIVTGRNDSYDVALINALTQDITVRDVEGVHARGIPVVHRKVNYAASGAPHMRTTAGGVVVGDRLQIDFEPCLTASVFQSEWSYRTYRNSGYHGKSHFIIRNGVDSNIFGLYDSDGGRRSFWDGNGTFRFVISTWSKDWLKGFRYYLRLDDLLASTPRISVDLVGRMPDGVRLRQIRVRPPLRRRELASFLRASHAYLAFSEHETCSNALLEAINTGLQVIYLDSGSNAEFASAHGIRYSGDFVQAVEELIDTYPVRLKNLPEHPYDIGPVADRYIEVLQKVRS